MKNKNLLTIILLSVFFSINIVSSLSGFYIETPSNLIKKYNTDVNFTSQVFRLNDSYAIIDGISCDFSLYDSQGVLLYSSPTLTTTTNTYDYVFFIDKNNFTRLGNYEYIIICNNTDEGGYTRNSIIITPKGLNEISENFLIIYFLIFMVLVFFSLFFIIMNITKFVLLDTTIIDVCFSFGIYLVIMTFYWISITYMNVVEFTDFINNVYMNTGLALLLVVLPFTSFAITIIKKSFDKKGVPSVQELTGRGKLFYYG